MVTKVVTANRLREGDVVYLTADGSWSEWLGDAQVVDDKDGEAALLAQAEESVLARLVIGPYAMKVELVDGRVHPVGQREAIRAEGPTVQHMGKLAVGS